MNKSTLRAILSLSREFRIPLLLRIAGIRQADVAKNLGVTQPTVNRVLHGKATSKKVTAEIENVLAARLGVLPEDLWR